MLAISVAGGDLQDQTTLNVLLNHIDFGMPPAEAVTAPRFSTGHHQNSFDPDPDREKAFVAAGGLSLQQELEAAVGEELRRRGHRVGAAKAPIAHPVMLLIDQETGMMHVAGDPAAKRHAAAIE